MAESPPAGWIIAHGVLEPDATVSGYAARGQDVRGLCRTRDCRRSCHVDYEAMTRQGFGGLSMTIVKRLLRCQRLDTCGLDFLEDPRTQGLPLKTLAGQTGVSLRFRCEGCGLVQATTPTAMIRRLTARERDGPATLSSELAALADKPCKTCGKMRWTVDILWPVPASYGYRQARSAAQRG
jgi:hypothetical protein